MLKIILPDENSMYRTTCPYCCADISWISLSPSFCPKCSESMEPFEDIRADMLDRVKYYRKGVHLNDKNPNKQ